MTSQGVIKLTKEELKEKEAADRLFREKREEFESTMSNVNYIDDEKIAYYDSVSDRNLRYTAFSASMPTFLGEVFGVALHDGIELSEAVRTALMQEYNPTDPVIADLWSVLLKKPTRAVYSTWQKEIQAYWLDETRQAQGTA